MRTKKELYIMYQILQDDIFTIFDELEKLEKRIKKLEPKKTRSRK